MLKGLNIRRNSAGKWYVSIRATGLTIVKGFEGTRRDLDRHMSTPTFLELYTISQNRKKKRTYPAGILGALIDWYETLDAWKDLGNRTKADYGKVKRFLEPVFAYSVDGIESADVIEMRDRAKAQHYAKFSNDVIAYMSSVFREAKDNQRMTTNPAHGVKRLYKAGKDANRRWKEEEWSTVFELLPAHLKIPLAIARWVGLRGQDIPLLTWSNYRNDIEMGKAILFVPLKNGDKVGELSLGAVPQLRAVLDPASKGTLPNSPICRNSLGKKFPSENALRKAWQDFKASDTFTTALPDSSDLTLHGLRVTFASELREAGFSDREVADALGDLSESMGKHYARGAEMRKTSVRVFKRMANVG
jgi:integrase